MESGEWRVIPNAPRLRSGGGAAWEFLRRIPEQQKLARPRGSTSRCGLYLSGVPHFEQKLGLKEVPSILPHAGQRQSQSENQAAPTPTPSTTTEWPKCQPNEAKTSSLAAARRHTRRSMRIRAMKCRLLRRANSATTLSLRGRVCMRISLECLLCPNLSIDSSCVTTRRLQTCGQIRTQNSLTR